jgi:hypothetical protein
MSSFYPKLTNETNILVTITVDDLSPVEVNIIGGNYAGLSVL